MYKLGGITVHILHHEGPESILIEHNLMYYTWLGCMEMQNNTVTAHGYK